MADFLENIEIKNFKSIRHQKIEGCKKINVFIGYPNVGKSNILEAMSFLSYGLKSTNNSENEALKDFVRYNEISELFFDGNIDDNITLAFLDKYRVRLKFGGENKIVTEVQYFDNHSWNRLQMEKASHQIISLKEREMFKSLNRVKVLNYKFKNDIPRNENWYVSLKEPFGENLYRIIERNSDLRKEVIELFEYYNLKLSFDKSQETNLKILKTLEDGTIFLIPFHQIADTLQRLIFYKAAIQTNKDSILLFEEPEAHMFPPYIRKFTSDVVLDKTNQFFIATHSPYVLDEFIEEAKDELAIFLVDYKDGETIIKNLSEKSLEEIKEFGVDLFFNLESYLKNG